jgi:CheY-like chemotaxis protein
MSLSLEYIAHKRGRAEVNSPKGVRMWLRKRSFVAMMYAYESSDLSSRIPGELPEMKRHILLVDDEVAVLLTMKAVLEISGFEVDTAASAREGKSKLKTRTYDMVITDMRMESDEAGREVIVAARTAPYHPAVALLTAFPVAEEDWQDMGADKMLVKPMQTRVLIQQIEKLLESHLAKLKKLESAGVGAGLAAGFAAGMAAASVKGVKAKGSVKKAVAKKAVAKKAAGSK